MNADSLAPLLCYIGDKYSEVPQSDRVTDVVEGRVIDGGVKCSAYLGTYHGELVSIRIFRPLASNDWNSPKGQDVVHMHKLIVEESIRLWQLRCGNTHRNIAHLLGLQKNPWDEDLAPAPPAIASVRGKYPSTMSYMYRVQAAPSPATYVNMIRDVANGLADMHSRTPPVIHGDLDPEIIPIDGGGVALLRDFGPQCGITLSLPLRNYNTLWAPEVTRYTSVKQITQASDIYSFAMTIYSLGTRDDLLAGLGLRRPWHASEAACEGIRPALPASLGGLDAPTTEKLYEILTRMWAQDPVDRPSIFEVQRDILLNVVGPLIEL